MFHYVAANRQIWDRIIIIKELCFNYIYATLLSAIKERLHTACASRQAQWEYTGIFFCEFLSDCY